MNFLTSEFSNIAVYKFLFLGFILFFLLRFSRLIIGYFSIKSLTTKIIHRYFPIFELILWLLFFAWAIQFFLKSNHLYAVIISIVTLTLMLMFAWFAMKDFIAGVIFRTSEKYSKKDYVKIMNYTGKIIDYTNRSLEIETDKGERIIIPYSKALDCIIVRTSPAEMMQNHTFKLSVNKNKALNLIIDEIKLAIIHLPWSSIKKESKIKLFTEDSDFFHLEITVYAFEEEYFYQIEDYIRKKYGKH